MPPNEIIRALKVLERQGHNVHEPVGKNKDLVPLVTLWIQRYPAQNSTDITYEQLLRFIRLQIDDVLQGCLPETRKQAFCRNLFLWRFWRLIDYNHDLPAHQAEWTQEFRPTRNLPPLDFLYAHWSRFFPGMDDLDAFRQRLRWKGEQQISTQKNWLTQARQWFAGHLLEQVLLTTPSATSLDREYLATLLRKQVERQVKAGFVMPDLVAEGKAGTLPMRLPEFVRRLCAGEHLRIVAPAGSGKTVFRAQVAKFLLEMDPPYIPVCISSPNISLRTPETIAQHLLENFPNGTILLPQTRAWVAQALQEKRIVFLIEITPLQWRAQHRVALRKYQRMALRHHIGLAVFSEWDSPGEWHHRLRLRWSPASLKKLLAAQNLADRWPVVQQALSNGLPHRPFDVLLTARTATLSHNGDVALNELLQRWDALQESNKASAQTWKTLETRLRYLACNIGQTVPLFPSRRPRTGPTRAEEIAIKNSILRALGSPGAYEFATPYWRAFFQARHLANVIRSPHNYPGQPTLRDCLARLKEHPHDWRGVAWAGLLLSRWLYADFDDLLSALREVLSAAENANEPSLQELYLARIVGAWWQIPAIRENPQTAAIREKIERQILAWYDALDHEPRLQTDVLLLAGAHLNAALLAMEPWSADTTERMWKRLWEATRFPNIYSDLLVSNALSQRMVTAAHQDPHMRIPVRWLELLCYSSVQDADLLNLAEHLDGPDGKLLGWSILAQHRPGLNLGNRIVQEIAYPSRQHGQARESRLHLLRTWPGDVGPLWGGVQALLNADTNFPDLRDFIETLAVKDTALGLARLDALLQDPRIKTKLSTDDFQTLQSLRQRIHADALVRDLIPAHYPPLSGEAIPYLLQQCIKLHDAESLEHLSAAGNAEDVDQHLEMVPVEESYGRYVLQSLGTPAAVTKLITWYFHQPSASDFPYITERRHLQAITPILLNAFEQAPSEYHRWHLFTHLYGLWQTETPWPWEVIAFFLERLEDPDAAIRAATEMDLQHVVYAEKWYRGEGIPPFWWHAQYDELLAYLPLVKYVQTGTLRQRIWALTALAFLPSHPAGEWLYADDLRQCWRTENTALRIEVFRYIKRHQRQEMLTMVREWIASPAWTAWAEELQTAGISTLGEIGKAADIVEILLPKIH